MVCLSTWIVPTTSLAQMAKIVGEVLSVNLIAHETTSYDEYPGYQIDFDDEYQTSSISYDAHISLLGIPSNLADLISTFPSEYSKKDENYCLTICSHNGLPLKINGAFILPYSNDEEMKEDIIRKLISAGLIVSKDFPPLIFGNEDF